MIFFAKKNVISYLLCLYIFLSIENTFNTFKKPNISITEMSDFTGIEPVGLESKNWKYPQG